VALLFLIQVVARFEQFLEQLLDVPTAGVLARDQLLKLLGEIRPRLVQPDEPFEHGTNRRLENFQVGVLVLGFLEPAAQHGEINLRQVRDQQEIIVLRMFPSNDTNSLRLLPPALVPLFLTNRRA
jgi:hypothetical protein